MNFKPQFSNQKKLLRLICSDNEIGDLLSGGFTISFAATGSRTDAANYELGKEDLITLGYEFLGEVNPYRLPRTPQLDESLETFRQNVRLFPDYWNSFDSYGDARAPAGNKTPAIEMYRKSLELKPDSASVKKALQKLLAEQNK